MGFPSLALARSGSGLQLYSWTQSTGQMRKHSTVIQKDLQRSWPREPCFLENYLTISNYIIIHSQVQCYYHFQSILQFLKSFHIITDWLILRLMFSSLERDARAQRRHIRWSVLCVPTWCHQALWTDQFLLVVIFPSVVHLPPWGGTVPKGRPWKAALAPSTAYHAQGTALSARDKAMKKTDGPTHNSLL